MKNQLKFEAPFMDKV